MFSDESYYYSSDSYSYEKSNSPIFLKRPFPIAAKAPIRINSRQIIKRGISNIANAKNTSNLPLRPIPVPNVINTSTINKKMINQQESESSYYYDYDYDYDNEDLPILPANRQSKPLNEKVINQTNDQIIKQPTDNVTDLSPSKISTPTKKIPQQTITYIEDDDLFQDETKNDSASSEFCDFFEYKPEYVDTNEEPEYTIIKKLIQNSTQTPKENVDSSNISVSIPNSKDCNTKEKLSFNVVCTKSRFSNYTFQFFSNDQCLMTASSSNLKKSITFIVPDHFEQEDIVIGTMTISKNKKHFVLDCGGREVMSAELSTVKKPFLFDSCFYVVLKNPETDDNDNLTLKAMLPKQKSSKQSIKSVVLNDNDDQKLIVIKKIEENQIKIDANSLIKDDLKIFALGIISWTFMK